MTGEIDGVTFTVIGTIGFRERYGGREWRWVDHQLFSPTHGYAFLTVEDHHLIFTRRFRGRLGPAFLSAHYVEAAENRPTLRGDEGWFQYYDTSTAEIDFVEGEFNWRPNIGDSSTTVSVLSEDAMLGFTQTATEQETERSVYLPHAETLAAFGAQAGGKPIGVHPLQPYKIGRHEVFLRNASLAFAGVAAALLIALWALSGGTQTAAAAYAVEDLPVALPIPITTKNRLARIRLSADVQNSWAYLGVALSDPDDVTLFEAGREIGAYHGRDHDGSWSEGSTSASLRFKPEKTGTHTLELFLDDADTWNRSGAPLSRVSVRITEGVSSPLWMAALTIGFLLLAAAQFGRYHLHQKRRWWGSDWVEEDDD